MVEFILIWSLLPTAQLSSMTMSAGQGSMLHLQSNMQHSPLGISIVNTHSGSVSFADTKGQKSDLWIDAGCGSINVRHDGICSSDVSVLHEWSAVSRIPVSYLNLPACTSAGVLFIPNRTTGTKTMLVSSKASSSSSSSLMNCPKNVSK